ncbi:hypothetical protein PFISCL1PPCAC_28343, partial [Pristionchus fissidentatus]
QSLPPLTLETLPKENVYQILSALSLSDRKRVRQCSKSMKDAIEASDLVVDIFAIEFDFPSMAWIEEDDEEGYLCIEFDGLGGKDELFIEDYTNEDEIEKLMDTLKMYFRRVKCNIVRIGGNKPKIDLELVEKILEFVDFCSLDLTFSHLHQKKVFEFALSSGRPIE